MATSALDRDAILRAIRAWPPSEQLALAREIWTHLGAPVVEEPTLPPSSRDLAGLISNGQTPPTDEEVAQWLDEHRMEKYGR